MIGWTSATLGELFDIARGGSPRPIDDYLTDDPDGLNWISISDASESSKYIERTARRIKPSGLAKTRLVHPGDFLLTNSMSFGRPYIMRTSGCIHDGWLVLSDKHKRTDPDYLYHLLGSDFMYRKFERLAAGATVKNLNIDLVSGVRIELPPLAEQKRLAAVLDAADALRAKRRAARAKIDTLAQSIFIAMFGDPLSPREPTSSVPFESVIRRITYGFTSPMSHHDTGIPIVTAKNVRNGFIDLDDVHYADKSEFDALTAKSKPDPGDLLITKDGTIGRCAIVPDGPQLCINQSVALVQPRHDLVLSTYLLAYLMTRRVQAVFQGMKKGHAIAHLQITELAKLPIPIPTLERQQQFRSLTSRHASIQDVHTRAAAALEEMFASLQHRAFRGEL